MTCALTAVSFAKPALKSIRDREFPQETVNAFEGLTDEQQEFLTGHCITKAGFSPKTETVPPTDFYYAKEFEIKVKGLSSYNVYNVCAVVIGDAGSLPVEIGAQMQAVNLAESFMQQGQLSAGTYAVMSRVGEKNVFYAPV